ncbi:hypothetical protein PF008_g11852 [Phytophthora fragariae]|uniref:Uncharacterized protein n=1 Tax=Phytophthora fragariae TaxID=53985 RepID=A0A6G0RR23_9STRA|nr:hypothetical protein PF008_g11852 [Phytophthora fragariae]
MSLKVAPLVAKPSSTLPDMSCCLTILLTMSCTTSWSRCWSSRSGETFSDTRGRWCDGGAGDDKC